MARRRSAEEEPQSQQPAGGSGSLAFNQPLSWRAGKPIATGELLRRLDTLATEVREFDQEEVDKDSFTNVAKELAGQNLLGHKDRGVRAFTACCLVDVLRICAPDAPFTPTQLKDIFTLFVTSILPALSDPSHAYNTQHKYVLHSLTEIKSILLVCDIPQSESLMLHLFSNFFDIVSSSSTSSTSEQIAKEVEWQMTALLATLVDEAQSLPAGAVDIIVAQFLRAASPGGSGTGKNKQELDEKQSTLELKEWPAAYNMAQTICNVCPEKMARYISQYFNDVIMEVSNVAPRGNGHRRASDAAPESDDEEGPTGPTEADMKELQKAHRLLRELWRASPAVLQNVVPQLEAELSAENVQLRLLATETLGDMISGIGAAGPPPLPTMDPATYPPVKLEDLPVTPVSNSVLTRPISPQSFAQSHPTVYQSFLGRKNDKSILVRSAWTTAVGRILVTSAGGIGLNTNEEKSFVGGLSEKLNDPDEKVRLAAVKAIGGFGLREIMTKLAPNGGVSKAGSVLSHLADRARDRKAIVRSEAMAILCRMWGVAAGEILAGNEIVIETLGGIPTKVFDVYYANDLETNASLDHVMFEQLIPLTYPPTKSKATRTSLSNGESQANGVGPVDADKLRAERILLVVNSLDPKSRKAFFALQARQPTFAQVLEAFLKRCEDYNGGVVDKDPKDVKTKLDVTIKWFTGFFPDPLRVGHDLQKFAKMHDRRSYQLLRFTMAPASDFGTVHKAIKELQKRIQGNSAAPAGLLDTLIPIIYRSGSLIYNRSHQPVYLQYARTNKHGLGATANAVMQEISDKHPEIFQASVKELCKIVEEHAPSPTKDNDLSSVDTLKSLASFAKSEKNKIPSDRKFIAALVNFALYGTPPKAAKYAVSILNACTDRKEMHFKDLLDKSLTGWEYGADHFLTKLATINQLALLAPATTEESTDEILDISRQLLLQVKTEKGDNDPSWQTDAEMDDECQAKCLAIKILVTRLRTVEDSETAKTLAAPVYKLLNALIVKEGELSKENNTPKHHKARLRLLAAQQMLKLCRTKLFDDILTPLEFNRLSFVTQDPLENIRRGFVEKLQKYLVKGELPARFLTIIFLTAFEPSINFRNSIMTWIRSRVKVSHESNKEQTKRMFEATFPRLLHLLAHHPDFSSDPVELADHAKYILYYLSTVISEDNLPLIYKYAQRVKQVRDAVPGVGSDNIYVLSDLAQALIQKWEEKKGWSMQTWTAKVGMPSGLFSALPSHEVAQEIADKTYIGDEMDPLLDGLIKEVDRKKHKRKSDDAEHPPSKKHKSSDSTSKPRPIKEKKERPAPKEKKTPKPKKFWREDDNDEDDDMDVDMDAKQSAADRRRSGRAKRESKGVYAERDSDQDDEEMWDGVAQWEYDDANGKRIDKAPAAKPEPDSEAEPEAEEEAAEDEEVEEVEEEVEEEEEEEDKEATPTPTPPISNGKRTSSRKKATPMSTPAPKSSPLKSKTSTRATRTKAPPAPPKKSSPLSSAKKPKAKRPLAQPKNKPAKEKKNPSPTPTKTNGRATRGKGKGKAVEKSIYDMDLSD